MHDLLSPLNLDKAEHQVNNGSTADPSPIQKFVGWEPKTSLEAGL